MHLTRFRTVPAVALIMTVLAGCADTSGAASGRISLGVLQLTAPKAPFREATAGNGAITWTLAPDERTVVAGDVLAAPDTVLAGEPFQVTVQTIGENGCWSAQRQDVSTSERTVELRPFDSHSGAHVCTEVLLQLTHVSTITLHETGEWVVRVSGLRVAADGSHPTAGVSAEKRMVVR